MAKTLGIYGAGGLAREVLELAKTINETRLIWDNFLFVDIHESNQLLNDIKVVSEGYVLEHRGIIDAVIAVGEPSLRNKIYDRILNNNIPLATLIHPRVRISDTIHVGNGVVISEGVTVSCNIDISDNVYIHPHVVIGHDTKIGKHCNIGSSSEIGGAVVIGERVFIGFLAGTIQGISIGNDAEISAGAIVFRDVEEKMIVMGNPARTIRRNEGLRIFSKEKNL